MTKDDIPQAMVDAAMAMLAHYSVPEKHVRIALLVAMAAKTEQAGLLRAAHLSGQMSAKQAVPHEAAGEFNPRNEAMSDFDLVAHLKHQREWSEATFGPGARTAGVIDHIRKELIEIEADPLDIREWVDVIILAFDGAWRSGWKAEDIVAAIIAKQAKNEARKWPDWRTADPDKAIEHDRSDDAAALPQAGEAEPVAYQPRKVGGAWIALPTDGADADAARREVVAALEEMTIAFAEGVSWTNEQRTAYANAGKVLTAIRARQP